jgi:hypothetical protein
MKKLDNLNNQQMSISAAFVSNLRHYLPLEDYKVVVGQVEQAIVLDKLKADTAKAKFSFVFDAVKAEISHCYGTEKILGYHERDFTIAKLLEVMHPAHVIPFLLHGGSSWDVLAANPELATFNNFSVLFTIAIKDVTQIFHYCSVESFCFQVSNTGRGTAFAYLFTPLKVFVQEELTVNYFDNNGLRPDIVAAHVRIAKHKFKIGNYFTEQEMRILKRLARDENATSEDIALAFKISKTTVFKHNSNILKKANLYFYWTFESAKLFAKFLQRQNLI